MEKVCRYCGQIFAPHPSVSHQEYCSDIVCQRARKRLWQRDKLAQDLDYRENRSIAQKKWRDQNPEYSREYRQSNPASAEKNRIKQAERNHLRRKAPSMIAKMDELGALPVLVSGQYRLTLIKDGVIAKTDELIVLLNPISRVFPISPIGGP